MCVQWASGRSGRCQETEAAHLIDDQSTIHNHVITVLFSYHQDSFLFKHHLIDDQSIIHNHIITVLFSYHQYVFSLQTLSNRWSINYSQSCYHCTILIYMRKWNIYMFLSSNIIRKAGILLLSLPLLVKLSLILL